jgi:hypothetical protein
MITAPIVKIRIDGEMRTAVVSNPIERGLRSHGLGKVGEPILPYLGARVEYAVVLPKDRRDLYVYEVNWDAVPKPNGKHPEMRLPWEELEAPDMPTLALFADEEIGAAQ